MFEPYNLTRCPLAYLSQPCWVANTVSTLPLPPLVRLRPCAQQRHPHNLLAELARVTAITVCRISTEGCGGLCWPHGCSHRGGGGRTLEPSRSWCSHHSHLCMQFLHTINHTVMLTALVKSLMWRSLIRFSFDVFADGCRQQCMLDCQNNYTTTQVLVITRQSVMISLHAVWKTHTLHSECLVSLLHLL